MKLVSKNCCASFSLKAREFAVQDILCEFLEVAIHNILYLRKIYPQSIYLPAKKYGIVLYQSVHTQLKAYITEILQSTQFYLKCGTVKRVIVSIESQKVTLERYIFNVIELKDQVERWVKFRRDGLSKYRFVFQWCVVSRSRKEFSRIFREALWIDHTLEFVARRFRISYSASRYTTFIIKVQR